jgi:hypothetical protein
MDFVNEWRRWVEQPSEAYDKEDLSVNHAQYDIDQRGNGTSSSLMNQTLEWLKIRFPDFELRDFDDESKINLQNDKGIVISIWIMKDTVDVKIINRRAKTLDDYTSEVQIPLSDPDAFARLRMFVDRKLHKMAQRKHMKGMKEQLNEWRDWAEQQSHHLPPEELKMLRKMKAKGGAISVGMMGSIMGRDTLLQSLVKKGFAKFEGDIGGASGESFSITPKGEQMLTKHEPLRKGDI